MDKPKKPVRIPGFKAVAVLGKGAQGVVYKGLHESTGEPVAIKVLAPKWARIPEFKARFSRESRVALSFDHPHIVKGLKAGMSAGLLYYVMEFADGPTLHDLVARQGPLDEGALLTLGIQAADALAYAHDRQLVHRDIKPGNFIVVAGPVIKLLDLGLAKETSSHRDLTLAGSVFGTANYISPEAVQDSKNVDARSDLYSLGATLYQAATGAPPFEGQNAFLIMEQVLREEPVPPRKRNPQLSDAFQSVLLHAMEKDPAARYPDARALKADLERITLGRKPDFPARKPSGRAARSPSGRSSRRARARPGLFARILRWFKGRT